jgi:hypothetical protein
VTPEQRLRLERGEEVFAGTAQQRVRRFLLELEPGTYTVRRDRGRRYVRFTEAEITRQARDKQAPIGGYTTAGFFKKCTG